VKSYVLFAAEKDGRGGVCFPLGGVRITHVFYRGENLPHAVPRFCPSEIFDTQSASPDVLINVCKEEEEEEKRTRTRTRTRRITRIRRTRTRRTRRTRTRTYRATATHQMYTTGSVVE